MAESRQPLLRSQLHRPLLLLVRLVGADLHQGASEAAPVVRVGRRQLKESKAENVSPEGTDSVLIRSGALPR